jgi:hypothetical protein
MAKFKVTSDCRFKGKAHKQGETVELNENEKGDAQVIMELAHAGRLEKVDEKEPVAKK